MAHSQRYKASSPLTKHGTPITLFGLAAHIFASHSISKIYDFLCCTPTILQQFEVADRDSTNISQYCGPYNTLLTDLFPHTEGFQVAPAFKAPMTPDSIDFTTRFIIRRYRAIELPVFFFDVKPALHTDDISTRKKADEQIREYFESIVGQNLVIPKLYGISAIGTRFSVYNYDKATGILSPPSSPRDSMQLVDVAPVNQWNFDLLEKTGEEK